jgi:thymidylate synthase
MSEGFPLLTTKKMPFKTVVTELLWFLRGDTNIKYLVDNNCHIWDGDAYKNYIKQYEKGGVAGIRLEDGTERAANIDEFIRRIKADDEFAKKFGELGPIYGKQWRSWKVEDNGQEPPYYNETQIDQIANSIILLKTDPDSRRNRVNAWNVGELDQMVLPPCHTDFQFYTRELTYKERYKIWFKNNFETGFEYNDSVVIDFDSDYFEPTPSRAISLMWNQRSVDTFLGLPFNIASYGLLLMMIADEVNMVPDELIGNLGDVHLYSNHIEQAKEQIGRDYTHEERHDMLKAAMGDFYNTAISEMVPFGGGLSEYYDSYKIPKKTREPFPLPTVHVRDGIFSSSINDFILSDYQSHETIKAPLSN